MAIREFNISGVRGVVPHIPESIPLRYGVGARLTFKLYIIHLIFIKINKNKKYFKYFF